MDPATGDIKWKYEMVTPPPRGLLATAGSLVFGGTRQGYMIREIR
jgi:alcohol dehydrogenase (cytochrome c)